MLCYEGKELNDFIPQCSNNYHYEENNTCDNLIFVKKLKNSNMQTLVVKLIACVKTLKIFVNRRIYRKK